MGSYRRKSSTLTRASAAGDDDIIEVAMDANDVTVEATVVQPDEVPAEEVSIKFGWDGITPITMRRTSFNVFWTVHHLITCDDFLRGLVPDK